VKADQFSTRSNRNSSPTRCETCSRLSDFQESLNRSRGSPRPLPRSTSLLDLVSSNTFFLFSSRRVELTSLSFHSLFAAEIQSADAVYVLAFSIIMLNTDLFSPQVRKRMTFEDYKKNLRGVNSSADFSDTFLVSRVFSSSSPFVLFES